MKFRTTFFTIIASIFSISAYCDQSQNLYPVEQDNQLGFIDETGKVIVQPEFDAKEAYYIGTGRDDLINVNKDGKRGILRTDGKLIIPTIYDNDYSSFDFNDGSIASFTLDGTCGYITDENKIIIKNLYERCTSFSEDHAAVRLNNKWAVIDQTGKQLTDFLYDEIDGFSEGLATVKVQNKYGYINLKGQVVIQPVHDLALKFEDGKARIGSISSPYYFIDNNGKKLFDVNFSHVYPFVGDYAVIRQDIGQTELYGLIDKQGKVYIKPKFTNIRIDKDNPELAIVEISKFGKTKQGILNLKTQKMLIEPIYESISTPYFGLAYFKKNKKEGWLDKNFNIVIPAQFDEILIGFGKGQLALVKVKNEIFYINKDGKRVQNFYLP